MRHITASSIIELHSAAKCQHATPHPSEDELVRYKYGVSLHTTCKCINGLIRLCPSIIQASAFYCIIGDTVQSIVLLTLPFQENQVSNHLKKSKEEMVALHLLSSSINMKYEKLKEEHEKIRRENHSLKEEIRRLRSR